MMRKVKEVKIADLSLDGGHIYIQSMLNKRSDDVEGNVRQAIDLETAGCENIRAAVPDEEALKLIPAIKSAVKIPLVADIHYDYRLAVKSAEMGIDKIRINPGNIGSEDNVKKVVDACKSRNIPIRIGVNSGSVEKDLLAKYGAPTAEALVESAMRHVEILERNNFYDTVISIKSSDVSIMTRAYRLLAEKCDYPLHLGVTEAGTERMGLIKSSVGIGSLLLDGIGETIRVSLTADPVREVYAARDILKAIGKRGGCEVVSCPTCGRTRIDIISIANQVEDAVKNIDKNLKIAVMGCVVNGPGEAREADIGIAGGNGCAVLFRKGEILRKIDEKNVVAELLAEIEKM